MESWKAVCTPGHDGPDRIARPGERIDRGQNTFPRQAECRIHAVNLQRIDENLAATALA